MGHKRVYHSEIYLIIIQVDLYDKDMNVMNVILSLFWHILLDLHRLRLRTEKKRFSVNL